MKKHFLVAFVIALCFTTATANADTLITNTGAPFKVTAKFGGPTDTTITTPDWIEVKKQTSEFADGWQTVTISTIIQPTDEPREGEITIHFGTITTQRFKVKQAGALRVKNKDDTITTQIPVAQIESVYFVPYRGDYEVVPLNASNIVAPKQRGWLFVKTRNGNTYSTWLFD